MGGKKSINNHFEEVLLPQVRKTEVKLPTGAIGRFDHRFILTLAVCVFWSSFPHLQSQF